MDLVTLFNRNIMFDTLNGVIVEVYYDSHWYQEIPYDYHIIPELDVKDVGCDIRDPSGPKIWTFAVCD